MSEILIDPPDIEKLLERSSYTPTIEDLTAALLTFSEYNPKKQSLKDIRTANAALIYMINNYPEQTND